jgi:replication factor C subunit 3/5
MDEDEEMHVDSPRAAPAKEDKRTDLLLSCTSYSPVSIHGLDSATGANLPWIEKFRPKGLDEIISNEDIIATSTIFHFPPSFPRIHVLSSLSFFLAVTRLIENNKLPNLLLYGPPGTGKTSTILACARKLNGPRFSSMVLELNASDERGIDVVREQIKDFASTRQIFSGGFKLVILDEADMMTKDAQFALRRVMEKYAKNTRFCLICNYVGKIIPALQSRCTRFRFSPLQPEHLKAKLRDIAASESFVFLSLGAVQPAYVH